MIPIDPKILELFPKDFLEKELAHFPNVREIKSNSFYYSLKNSFGYFSVEDGTITLDPTVAPKIIATNANKNHPELGLLESEAWIFMFWHECHHSQFGRGEWSADNFSIKKILELRNDGIKNLVRETLKKELAR